MDPKIEPVDMKESILLSWGEELTRLFHEGDGRMKRKVVKAAGLNHTCTSVALYSSLIQPFEGLRKGVLSELAARG